jgi:hypothetical protein
MQNVDLNATPKDFRVKYFDHYKAWRDYYRLISGQTGQQVEGMDPEKLAQLGQGAIRLYSGDPSGFLSMMGAASDDQNQGPSPAQKLESRIYETFMTVQRAAVQYGASISESETIPNRGKGLRINRIEIERREWDQPALFEEDDPPDVQLEAYSGGELACQPDVVQGYSLSPQCTIYPSSTDTVLVRLYDLEGENREPTHIGSWRESFDQLLPSQGDTSFGGVPEFKYSIISGGG